MLAQNAYYEKDPEILTRSQSERKQTNRRSIVTILRANECDHSCTHII